MKKIYKIILYLFLTLATLYFGLCFYLNSVADTERLIVDYTHEGAFTIPVVTTEFYLFNIRNIDASFKNSTGQNLIHFSGAAYGDKEVDNSKIIKIILHLISLGVDINEYQDDTGMTEIHHAVLMNKPQYLKFLLKNGIDSKLTIKSCPLKGKTALRMIEDMSKTNEKDKEILRNILKNL